MPEDLVTFVVVFIVLAVVTLGQALKHFRLPLWLSSLLERSALDLAGLASLDSPKKMDSGIWKTRAKSSPMTICASTLAAGLLNSKA